MERQTQNFLILIALIASMLLGMWVQTKNQEQDVITPTVNEKKLEKDIDSLKAVINNRTEIIKTILQKAEEFDSLITAEKERRKNAEIERDNLRRLLREKLQRTNSDEKRQLLMKRYEKANF